MIAVTKDSTPSKADALDIIRRGGDWTAVVPLPPLLVALGCSRATWLPNTGKNYREYRLILVEDGESPGVFEAREAFGIQWTPTKAEIRRKLAEIQRPWDDEVRLRRGPHMRVGQPLLMAADDEMKKCRREH